VLAQVAQLGCAGIDQASGSGAEDGLAAVAAGGDACGPMDIGADVAPVVAERFASVQADADADRTGQPLLDLCRGGDRVASGGEHAEEGVTLGIDLDAAVVDQRLADDPLMVR